MRKCKCDICGKESKTLGYILPTRCEYNDNRLMTYKNLCRKCEEELLKAIEDKFKSSEIIHPTTPSEIATEPIDIKKIDTIIFKGEAHVGSSNDPHEFLMVCDGIENTKINVNANITDTWNGESKIDSTYNVTFNKNYKKERK